MKKQILILGNTLIALIIFLMSVIGYQQLKSDYITMSENNLETVTRYLDTSLDKNSLAEPSVRKIIEDSLAIFADSDSGLRITVMDAEGEVLADSDFSLDELNNHRNREEVYSIIKGDTTYISMRHSDTEDVTRLYYSIKSKSQDAIIRAAVKLTYLTEAKWIFFNRSLLVAAVFLVFFNLIIILSSKKLDRYVNDNIETLDKIKRGDLSSRLRMDRPSYPELDGVSKEFNEMIKVLENEYKQIQTKRASLDAMVNSLMEPLVVVNNQLQVVFSNKYARNLFDRDIDPTDNPYPFILLTHEAELDDLCEKVLATGETIREEFLLQIAGRYNAFQITISPVDAEQVVVLFNDVSQEYEVRELRSSFVANVTHELKTPLTSIRGFVETLRNRDNTEPEQLNNFLEIIDIEAARLERLINDILKLSDIERLDTDTEIEDFDLVELVDECLVQLDDQISEKQINILPSDEPFFLPVKANRDRIKQVLLNLLENAIKYHRPQGSVWINWEREGEYVTIKVRDDGYGFDEQAAKRVFERFYRVDKSRSRLLGGTGLGLSIVKHIALLYKGEVSVQSTPDVGTTFTIRMKI